MIRAFSGFNFSLRLFAAYFLIIGLAAYWAFNLISSEVKPTIRQATEEALIDTANLLAEFAVPLVVSDNEVKKNNSSGVEQSYDAGRLLKTGEARQYFEDAIQRFSRRQYQAQIFGITKENSNNRIYVTNDQGIVVFDSAKLAEGEDYSQWNDVYLTLRGRYGARSTKDDPEDEGSSVMYVAAPVLHKQKIVGVLTVAKENRSLRPFFALINAKLKVWGGLLLVVSILLGGILSYWMSGSIRRLVQYAMDLKHGENRKPPHLQEKELRTLAEAMRSLRQALTGKEYVEEYLLTMTHEMKSPLSAIMGAAELMHPSMDDEDLEKFIRNIRIESERLNDFMKRMLDVARVENLSHLETKETIDVISILRRVQQHNELFCQQKSISFQLTLDDNLHGRGIVQGSPFLLQQALDNIVSNALDFSPQNSKVVVHVSKKEYPPIQEAVIVIQVSDEGSGIPEYAIEKVFDRFYSLPRPHTGKRSSGLGLTFVKRAIELHKGEVKIENRSSGGAIATITLPEAYK